MPYFKYTTRFGVRSLISYYWEVVDGGEYAVLKDDENTLSGEKGETFSFTYRTKYNELPYCLKSILDYCAMLYSIHFTSMWKERLVRLVVAEGLIKEMAGEENASSLEESASSFIHQLVQLGMLISEPGFDPFIEVHKAYYKLCVLEGKEDDFLARSSLSPIRLFIHLYNDIGIPPDLKNLPIQSLFLHSGFYQLSQATIDTIRGLRSLLVLDVQSFATDMLSNEVVELVYLRFLGLRFRFSSKIPLTFGDLQHLQTLELYSRSNIVPNEVADFKTLRHLQMSSSPPYRVPKWIGSLVNLQTLIGWDAKSDITCELFSSLTQLRHLHIHNVCDENVNELLKIIMTKKNLISLFMRAEAFFCDDVYFEGFLLLEPFSPPPQLQKLYLHGPLMELPNWFTSMNNLTVICLNRSNLVDNPCSILQFLPKLTYLELTHAYRAKLIGKGFCSAVGFPKLETLVIGSTVLVEWTEVVVGAFSHLTSLTFDNCPNLLFLPEGLQNISTLQELNIRPAHEDLIRRLNSDENYKIKHISSIKFSPRFS